MKTKRAVRFVTPRELDERFQSIQLLVIRDAFMAILLMAVCFVTALAFFPSFINAHLGEIGGVAIVSVGLVGWISNHLRGGLDKEQQALFAKGEFLVAPFLAAIVVFLTNTLFGAQLSLLQWLLLYGVTLLSFLVYPLFLLQRVRKHTNRQEQTRPFSRQDD
ncbi:MAG: hypothetical protein ABI456_00040 [Ktedonobacteraceae bacterium]